MPRSLRIRCFMHVPFEGPGVIADWAESEGHRLEVTRFWEGDPLPPQGETDMLVIMGGPMDAIDEGTTPWMPDELTWIREFTGTGKPVLGICLGAQLVARALGATVYSGKEKEIGWHRIRFLPAPGTFRIWPDLPPARKVFHWHGDTFTLPEGATLIASSLSFPNQGFLYGERVVALQFHLEVTPEGVRELLEHGRHELTGGPAVQTEKEILKENGCFAGNQQLMFRLLDYLSG